MVSSVLFALLLAPGPEAQAKVPGEWTLALGGDVMLNGVPWESDPLEGIGEVFRSADIAIVNLEIPLTLRGTPTSGKSAREIARRQQYVLRADPRHAIALGGLGIDVVTLGNNHAMDYGRKGLEEMFRALDATGILHTGAGGNESGARRPALLQLPGTPRVAVIAALAFKTTGGLYACTPAGPKSPGVAALDFGQQVDAAAKKRIGEIVARSRIAVDLLIVSLHWGTERQTVPTPYQVALGRAFVDAGADVVVGHHPHVLQGAEIYRGKPILYSMGNLVSPIPANSAIARLRFRGRLFVGMDIVPTRISGGRVQILSGSAAEAGRRAFVGLCRRVKEKYPAKGAEVPRVGSVGRVGLVGRVGWVGRVGRVGPVGRLRLSMKRLFDAASSTL